MVALAAFLRVSSADLTKALTVSNFKAASVELEHGGFFLSPSNEIQKLAYINLGMYTNIIYYLLHTAKTIGDFFNLCFFIGPL